MELIGFLRVSHGNFNFKEANDNNGFEASIFGGNIE